MRPPQPPERLGTGQHTTARTSPIVCLILVFVLSILLFV